MSEFGKSTMIKQVKEELKHQQDLLKDLEFQPIDGP